MGYFDVRKRKKTGAWSVMIFFVIKYTLVIMLFIFWNSSSLFAEFAVYKKIQEVKKKLDTELSLAVQSYNKQINQIKNIRAAGHTKKADRLSKKLGDWASFINKKMPRIEKRHIRRNLRKTFRFEAPWKNIYELEGVDFYDTNMSIPLEFEYSEETSLTDKIKELQKSVRKISKRLSPQGIAKQKKIHNWIRRLKNSRSEANVRKIMETIKDEKD